MFWKTYYIAWQNKNKKYNEKTVTDLIITNHNMTENYTINEEAWTFNLYWVKICEITEQAKSIKMDAEFMSKVIDNFNTDKIEKDYKPTVFVWHEDFTEKKAIGFIDNLRLDWNDLLVDLVDILLENRQLFRDFPYRSPEFLVSWSLLWLALLWHSVPYFKSSPVYFSSDKEWDKFSLEWLDNNILHFKDTPMEETKTPEINVDEIKSNFDKETEALKVAFQKQEEELKVAFQKQEEEMKEAFKAMSEEKEKISKELEVEKSKILFSDTKEEITTKFSLSETKSIWFAKDEQIDLVTKFAISLSEEDKKCFYEILESIQYADLTSKWETATVDKYSWLEEKVSFYINTFWFSKEKAEEAAKSYLETFKK